MTYKIINDDNMNVNCEYESAQVIFADYVYENLNFSWINKYWDYLKIGGIFIAMADFHSVFELGCYLKTMMYSKLVNHLVYKNEWGNHPKDKFHQCFDDIIIFSKGKHSKFYFDRIQIPKATANTKLNPSGRQTKTATAFINDICLTTTSKERIKQKDKHLIRWQKPLGLMNRILLPFTDEGDLVIDPFCGSGTTGEWCIRNNRNFIGIENDYNVFELAKNRLDGIIID
jgi:site-specific DNA-methyltransferase (adenine-specific)